MKTRKMTKETKMNKVNELKAKIEALKMKIQGLREQMELRTLYCNNDRILLMHHLGK